VFLKIFYNLRKLLIISNLTLQTFNFMTFYTELIHNENFVKVLKAYLLTRIK